MIRERELLSVDAIKIGSGDNEFPPNLKIYLGDLPEPLSSEAEAKLRQQLLSKNPDTKKLAREELIRGVTRLVVSIAKRYRGRGIPFADLIQEGNCGAVWAMNKFNPLEGVKFSTYANDWIHRSVQIAVWQGQLISLPTHMGERLKAINEAHRTLFQSLEREPSLKEMAKAIGKTPKQLAALLLISKSPLSLDFPYSEDTALGDFIADNDLPSPEEETSSMTLKEQVEKSLKTLSSRERYIIGLRFGLNDGKDYTLEAVGQRLKLSRERVRRIQEEALQKLRHPSRARKLRSFYQ